MESNTAVTIILVLLSLLGIQIIVLFILKKMITKLSDLINELKQVKHRSSIKYSKELISEKSFKTCQNCYFRQSFLKSESASPEILFYRCRLNGIEVDLTDSCNQFQLESSTQNS